MRISSSSPDETSPVIAFRTRAGGLAAAARVADAHPAAELGLRARQPRPARAGCGRRWALTWPARAKRHGALGLVGADRKRGRDEALDVQPLLEPGGAPARADRVEHRRAGRRRRSRRPRSRRSRRGGWRRSGRPARPRRARGCTSAARARWGGGPRARPAGGGRAPRRGWGRSGRSRPVPGGPRRRACAASRAPA